MIKRILCVCLIGFITSGLYGKEYPFTDAYSRTLSVNDLLAASRREETMYQAQKAAARGLRLPELGVKGAFSRISDPISIDLNGIRSAIQPLYPVGTNLPSFELQVQDEQFFKAQAYASLPIYSGGKITAAELAASANYAGAVAKSRLQESNLLVELAGKYFGVLLAGKVESVRVQILKNARQNAQDGEKMYRAGTISRVEKMALDVTLAQAQRDYQAANNDLAMAKILLKSLLAEENEISLTTALFAQNPKQLPLLKTFQEQALSHHPALFLLDSKSSLSKAGEKAQQADFLPSVYLFGSRELYTHDLTLLEPDYAYGIGFSWNLFAGGRTYQQQKAAREQTRSLGKLREQQVTDILTGLEFYYKKLQNAWETHVALQEELAFTKAFYHARQVGFRAGAATSLEVNNALAQWQKAQLDDVKAQYDFVISLASLFNLSGQPEEFERYLGE
ncbi:TolC family protein [Candidatus Avelusimicrobium faecicola]|uniref:TolC family protein n=1 Tax=Candidatus Avelusimicrobium faecicola TaxID=3416205 RepID=UPI0015A14539